MEIRIKKDCEMKRNRRKEIKGTINSVKRKLKNLMKRGGNVTMTKRIEQLKCEKCKKKQKNKRRNENIWKAKVI